MSELSKNETENFPAYVTKFEQCAYIKIKTLCSNTVPIIHASLKEVCGNATLDKSTVQWWHKCFRERRASTEDNSWSVYSDRQYKIAIFTTVLDKDQHVMVREIETEIRIPQTTVHGILTEYLFKKKVVA